MIPRVLIALACSVFVLFIYIEYVQPLRRTITSSDAFPGSIAATVIESSLLQSKEKIAATVQVITEYDGRQYIRLSNITRVQEFPACSDLKVYITNTLSIEGAVHIGSFNITAGAVNYKIADTVRVSDYTHLLLWCPTLRTVYGYAEIIDPKNTTILR
jgi:hypothetical protein